MYVPNIQFIILFTLPYKQFLPKANFIFLHRSLPMQIKMDSETDKTVPLPRCRIQRHI